MQDTATWLGGGRLRGLIRRLNAAEEPAWYIWPMVVGTLHLSPDEVKGGNRRPLQDDYYRGCTQLTAAEVNHALPELEGRWVPRADNPYSLRCLYHGP